MRNAARGLFDAPLPRPEPAPGLRLGRGWHAGPEPIWSRHPQALLEVEAARWPEPVSLPVRLSVFGATPDRPRQLRVTSPGHPDIAVAVTSEAPLSLPLRTPRHAEGAAFSAIRFALDAIDSPLRRGHSPDERLLGLRLLALAPGRPALSLPLDLAAEAAGAEILQDGWAPPDAEGGAWSIGDRARLRLPGHLCNEARLLLEGRALPRPEGHPPLRVEIHCDGRRLLAPTALPGPEVRLEIALPPAAPFRDRELVFGFHDAASPQALGMSEDPRPLGLQLWRISNPSISQAKSPPAAPSAAPGPQGRGFAAITSALRSLTPPNR
ncbi:hypothetical protein [Limimaricola pyoseonensis]|uniref:Uncharacterized protein n=1 Tax=Limimaricola pyoseonensis TaxID=521013 RepID=A0A1G7KJT5_9RHOB|nr:hypothetical protein [Limimaricola pyoseonensis]SDF37405.1 hypothetical protein SAMN04488567_0227 [Limimaricola pyoseonensis]